MDSRKRWRESLTEEKHTNQPMPGEMCVLYKRDRRHPSAAVGATRQVFSHTGSPRGGTTSVVACLRRRCMTFIKTELGQRVFKERSRQLATHQRAAFILFDGHRSVQDVISATAGMGMTMADITHMLDEGLIAESAAATPVPPSARPASPIPAPLPQPGSEALSEQARYTRAYPIATALVASLGLRGFKLNLAVEKANGYADLLALAPRLREALGAERCAELDAALGPNP